MSLKLALTVETVGRMYIPRTEEGMKVKVLVAQSCPTLCDPMNGSTPGLPVHQFT